MHRNLPGKIGLLPIILLSALIVIAALLSFYGWKILQTAKKIQFENPSQKTADVSIASFFPGDKRVALRGEDRGRINILLLGRAGEKYPGRNLTDTVMVASIDTQDKRIGFLSLPRDLYVEIPKTGLSTKLNSLYQYGLDSGQGIDPLESAITDITGLSIDYFIALDFDGFEKIVDTVGGVSIDAERDQVTLSLRPTVTAWSGDTVSDPAVALSLAGACSTSTSSACSQSSISTAINSSSVPVIDVREMESVVTVPSGAVVVMGGLMQEVVNKQDSGLPGAMDVPILGNLFKANSDQTKMTELVVFLKASVVHGASPVDPSDQDTYKRFMHDPRPLGF